MNTEDKEIAKLNAEIAKLYEQRQEREKYLANLTESQRLADALHKKLCQHNHTDYCNWYYSDWSKPDRQHLNYLEKASNLLKVTDLGRLLTIVDLL